MKEKTKIISLKLRESEIEYFNAIAEEYAVSLAQVIRGFIRYHTPKTLQQNLWKNWVVKGSLKAL